MRLGWWLAFVGCIGCRYRFDHVVDGGGDDDASVGDGASSDANGDGGTSAPRMVYGSTQQQMFRIDPSTLVETVVMPLCNNIAGFQISDLAVSSTGEVVVADLASTALHRADATGNCTLIRNLGTRMYGLEYVPPGVIGVDETLLGAGDDDSLYRIDPVTGLIQLIGPFGFRPGDIAWTGTKLVMTAEMGATFLLADVDLTTGAATVIGDMMRDHVYGLVWANSALFAFSSDTAVLEVNPTTGATIRTKMNSRNWYGAAWGP